MDVRVYGPGCANCKRLEQRTREALAKLGQPADVAKVEELGEITDAGVMRTPALGIDGKIVLEGRVPDVPELTTIITTVLAEG
jgi:small redox-active disulfide protein 2